MTSWVTRAKSLILCFNVDSYKIPKWETFSKILFYFFDAGNQMKDFVHAREAFCHSLVRIEMHSDCRYAFQSH